MIKYWLQKIWLLFYFSLYGEWKLVREEWNLSQRALDEGRIQFEELDKINRKRLAQKLWHADAARKQEPDGIICFFCKKDNFFADELGFFYINPEIATDVRGGHPCCESCYTGEPGRKHVERMRELLTSYGPIELWAKRRGLYEKVLEAERQV